MHKKCTVFTPDQSSSHLTCKECGKRYSRKEIMETLGVKTLGHGDKKRSRKRPVPDTGN